MFKIRSIKRTTSLTSKLLKVCNVQYTIANTHTKPYHIGLKTEITDFINFGFPFIANDSVKRYKIL